MTHVCAATGCDQPATLQWRRECSPAELDQAITVLNGVRLQRTIESRERAKDALNDLATYRAMVGDDATNRSHVLNELDKHEKQYLAELDALADPEPVESIDGAGVSVFACDTHKLDNEAASKPHKADCQAPPTCTCM